MPFNPPFINLQPDSLTSNLAVQGSESGEDIYLRLRLGLDISAAIALCSVQEAFLLPTRQLTAMPNMPASVLGLTHRRNQVVWVFDLAQLLDIAVLDVMAQQYSILLIQVGQVQVALAVRNIEGMVRIPPDAVQSPIGQMNRTLLPYLKGCALLQLDQKQVNQKSANQKSANQKLEMLLLLDAEAILQAPVMQDSIQDSFLPV